MPLSPGEQEIARRVAFTPDERFADLAYDASAGNREELLREMSRGDLAPGAMKLLQEQHQNLPPEVASTGAPGKFDLDGARKAGYSDREIAGFLAPQFNFDLEGAQRAGYSPTEIIDGLTASPKFTDYAKSLASGALSGTGMIFQGGGELLARGINAVAPQAELRAVNPFQGAIDWLETSKSPAAHAAEAGTQITGSLFEPDTWSFGTNPTLSGLALQGVNAIGQFAPNLAIALGTAGASIPAQLSIGAVTGGLQALGGGAEEERNKFAQMGPDELQASSALYRTLIERGVDHETAKGAVAEAAALGGGLGNAIPSAGEGAFENFIVGALTRGRLKIPGKGLIGKAAVGATGGAAMGGTEEALEQVGQNVGSNLAIGGNRPLTADTLQQFVMGAIAEGVAGAGGGAMSHVTMPKMGTNMHETGTPAVDNEIARVVNPAATVDKANTEYRSYINALDQAPNADAAVAAASAAVDAPIAPDEKIAAFVQAEHDAQTQRQADEEAAYRQRDERIASLNRQIEMLGKREAEQIAEGKAQAEIAATESAQADARDQVRGLVASNLQTAPDTAMARALAGAAGVNPDEAFAARGRDMLARMEDWQAKQPVAQPVPTQAAAPALTDDEIARRMTASIPEKFTPAAPLPVPVAPVTIMGAKPEKLTTPELRVSAEAAAKPEQRQAAKVELDRRAQAYKQRGMLTPAHDSMFTAIAKLGGLNKQDVVSSWGVDPADVKGLNPIFGKPLLRTNGGLSIDGMAELLVQHGYLDQRDLQEFERKFDQELRGKPVLTPQGMERQAAATAEATSAQQALDERAASLDLTPQELASVGYDKLHAVEQEQYQTILDNLVQSAQGKPYESLVAEIIERAIVQTEGRPFKEYAQAVIAQINEVINAQSTVNQPAQTVSGAGVQGAQENHPATGSEGRASAAEPVRQVAGAELALTGQTAAEVKAQGAAAQREAAAKKQREAAPPPEEFTLAGSSRQADQAAAHGQQELVVSPAEATKETSIISDRPYRDTQTKALQHLARETDDDAVLKAVEDELNTRAEEHARVREERLAKGRAEKAKPKEPSVLPESLRVKPANLKEETEAANAVEAALKEKGIKFSRSVWYSDLARQLGTSKQEVALPQTWKSIIANLKGVKKEEIEWTGINDWLDLQQSKVTRAQILDYLNENGVKVEEVTLEQNRAYSDEELARKDELDRIAAGGHIWTREQRQEYDRLTDRAEGDTKFASYQLPGGENYRELLLTLPVDQKAEAEGKSDRLKELIAERDKIEATSRVADTPELRAERQRMLHNVNVRIDMLMKRTEPMQAFKSSHFDQPNILAHIRFNERADAQGKRVLFIEELQSDWAQKGKREGFARDVAPDAKRLLELEHLINQRGLNDAENAEYVALRRASKGDTARLGIPAAPFVGKTESWVALALKRMIRYAAENGFDRVAWTTGEQQNERYTLSAQIEELRVFKRDDGTVDLSAKKKDTGQLHDIATRIPESKVADYVGKEMAERIARGEGEPDKGAGKWRIFSGLDLKVGGEGMRAFYDKIVPNVANDVLKKLGGGKVSMMVIPGTGERTPAFSAELHPPRLADEQPGFDITPALKEHALAGMPLFSRGKNQRTIPTQPDETYRAKTDQAEAILKDAGYSFKIDPVSVDVAENAAGRQEGNGRRDSFELAKKVSALFGKEVIPVTATGDFAFDGFVMPGSPLSKYVFIDASADKPAHVILGHELSHHMEKDAPAVYRDLVTALEPLIFDVQGYQELHGMEAKSEDYAVREIVGDLLGNNFGDQKFWAEVAKRSTAFGKIVATIRQWLSDLTAKLKGMTGFQVEQFVSDVDDARKVLAAATVDYLRNRGNGVGGYEAKFARPIADSKTTGDYKDTFAAKATDFMTNYFTSFDKIGWWQKTVGTPFNLALTNKEFAPFYDEGQAYINDISRYGNESADLAQDLLPRVEHFRDVLPAWLGGKTAAQRGDVMAASKALYAGTLWGNGSPMEGRVWTDAELKSGRATDNGVSIPAFNPMSAKQIALYRQALAATSKSMDELAKSLIQRIARQADVGFDRGMSLEDVATIVGQQLEDKLGAAKNAGNEALVKELQIAKTSVADIADKAKTLNEAGYFPAMRFGKYALHVVKGGKQLYFGMYESKAQALVAEQKLKQEFPGAEIQKGVIPKEKYKLFQGLSLDALEAFSDYIVDAEGNQIAKDALVQGLLKAATAERSVMKRHIHRKGIPGYSEDVPRVLASFVVSSARAIASNYHAAEMLKLAQDIKAGDVSDYAAKLARYMLDPVEEAQGLRGFLFAQYLGGSIASGLVNMTQPFMVTAPWASKYTSYADAVAKLGKAGAENADALTGKIGEAYRRAKREGIVTPQEIHQLRAETGGGLGARSLAMRKLSFAWGSIFSLAEQFNRKSTFLAAYRIAEEMSKEDKAKHGITNSYDFAKQAVAETQFTYNKGNRPVFSRGMLGATVMTFKQFSISYLEMAHRLYKSDKKAFALLALTLLAAGGIEGLPFAEDLEDLVDTFGQWLGYATNSKKKVRQWAMTILGPDLSQVALRGVSGLSWMPVDISARMGMANLIPGTAALKPSEKNKTKDVVEMLGPAGQFLPLEGTMVGNALERLGKGDIGGAIKAAAPQAIQAAVKGGEMLETGKATDLKGRKITAVSPGEAVLKMAGLQPASVARESQKIGIVQQDIDLVNRMKSEIAEQWARGIVDKDPAEVRAARDKMARWNEDNAELRIHVNSQAVQQRIKEMRMTREERFVKRAPKDIRAGVREALR